MKDIIITILAIVVAYGIMSNHFGFSIKNLWKRAKGEGVDPVVDYNTLKIKSVSELDDFDRTRLKKEYEALCLSVKEVAEAEAARQLQDIAEHNGKCPSCHDQEVTQRIETGSESRGYGRNKSTHTTKTTINHCRACGHDWEHKDNRTYTTSKYDVAEQLIRLLRYYHEAKHETEFDPNKLDNKYDTLQETREAAMRDVRKNHFFDMTMQHFQGKSVELAKYLVEEVYGEYEMHDFKLEMWHKHDKAPLLEWGLKEI